MPAKRDYNVKGTNDFIVLAAIFFFLCIWAVKDAWFPSEKVLKRHPLEIEVAFQVGGAVEKVHVGVGDSVGEKQLLAELRTDRVSVEYDKSREDYVEAKNNLTRLEEALKQVGSEPERADLEARAAQAKQEMDAVSSRVHELRQTLDASVLKSLNKGKIQEVLVGPHSMVEKGQVAVVIDPKDHFYLFNKSLTVLSFILFWVFLAIHVLAR